MEELFLEILEEHQAIIHKVCRMYRDTKEDQEDLFQEIVLQLWKSFPKFRNDAKVSTWMYRIALNTAMTTFRKNRVALEFTGTIPNEPDPGPVLSENEERMFEALRKLSEAERALVALFFDGYSHHEIGELLGITENNVGVKISRIKDKLKNILK